ncbi:hypothetical protein C8R45DRAFT_1139061 [Mycena sanguinolenta]|nr:hypothetical protein C8R45DRAFT_1139061 [Mycena sanguinolenta]
MGREKRTKYMANEALGRYSNNARRDSQKVKARARRSCANVITSQSSTSCMRSALNIRELTDASRCWRSPSAGPECECVQSEQGACVWLYMCGALPFFAADDGRMTKRRRGPIVTTNPISLYPSPCGADSPMFDVSPADSTAVECNRCADDAHAHHAATTCSIDEASHLRKSIWNTGTTRSVHKAVRRTQRSVK